MSLLLAIVHLQKNKDDDNRGESTILRETMGLPQNHHGTENSRIPPSQDGNLAVYTGSSKVAV